MLGLYSKSKSDSSVTFNKKFIKYFVKKAYWTVNTTANSKKRKADREGKYFPGALIYSKKTTIIFYYKEVKISRNGSEGQFDEKTELLSTKKARLRTFYRVCCLKKGNRVPTSGKRRAEV